MTDLVRDRYTFADFPLERGGALPEVAIAYTTRGRLAPDGRNAVLVTHGYTSGHQMIEPGAGSSEGAWSTLVGPGAPIDTDRYYVVASNMLGSSFGSTNAASIDPRTGKPYGSSLPGDHCGRYRHRPAPAAAAPGGKASARGGRPVLWRLPGVPVVGDLPGLHGRDRAGGVGAEAPAGHDHRAACPLRPRPQLERRRLLRHRRDGGDA